jgi:hypothetical protein
MPRATWRTGGRRNLPRGGRKKASSHALKRTEDAPDHLAHRGMPGPAERRTAEGQSPRAEADGGCSGPPGAQGASVTFREEDGTGTAGRAPGARAVPQSGPSASRGRRRPRSVPEPEVPGAGRPTARSPGRRPSRPDRLWRCPA